VSFSWPNFQLEFDVPSHTILLTLAGSRSYGTDHPLSDWDYTGILIPPPTYQHGPFRNFKVAKWKDGEPSGRVSEKTGVVELEREGVIRNIKQFFFEAAKSNPNVVEGLFVPDSQIAYISAEGELLRNSKEMFLSQRAARSFGGYAFSQLKRIEGHYGYHHHGRPEVPSREEFGLPPRPSMRVDQQGAADAFVRRFMHEVAPWLQNRPNEEKQAFWEAQKNILAIVLGDEQKRYDPLVDNWHEIEQEVAYIAASQLGLGTNFIEYIKLEKAYGQLLKKQRDYDNWVKNRNPARAELEARYGYDCKHAMHLVRLVRSGTELLLTGNLQVNRPDAQELKEIRNGAWKYEDLISWSHKAVNDMYNIVREGRSVLPQNPDEQQLQIIYDRLLHDFNSRMGY